MRINKFFAAALAATTLFASCTKENVNDGGKTGEGEVTYAGISISVPMSPAGTRAGAEADIATGDESKIENVAVFIVDGTTVDKLYLESGDFTFNTGTGIATANKAIRTTTGAKTIYIVANYTATLKAKIESMGAAAFGQSAIALNESNFITSTNALTMTGTKDKTLDKQSAEEAIEPANLINIDVYRNLAKVVVHQKTADSHKIVGGGWHKAGSLEFALAVKAQGAWLHNTPNDGASATAYTVIPEAAATDDTHAFWTNFSNRTVGTTATDWKAVHASTAALNTMAGWYAHENIYTTLLSGNTTIARLRGAYIPAKTVTAYNATTGVRTETTNTESTTPATFRRLGTDGSYWSTAAYNAAIAESADDFHIPVANFSAEYANGIGYYKIMVMDEARVPVVKRNNFYDLAIEAIEGPGSPAEVSVDEEVIDPLDEESYVAVTVTVKDWWKQSTGHTIQ